MTGMPLLKIDFISNVLALAEPVPFTVAILMAKSLMRAVCMGGGFANSNSKQPGSGDLRLFRSEGLGLVIGVRPVHEGLLHVPRGGRAALRAQATVNAQVLVLDHDASGLFQRRGHVERLREVLRRRLE